MTENCTLKQLIRCLINIIDGTTEVVVSLAQGNRIYEYFLLIGINVLNIPFVHMRRVCEKNKMILQMSLDLQ